MSDRNRWATQVIAILIAEGFSQRAVASATNAEFAQFANDPAEFARTFAADPDAIPGS